MSQEFWLFVVLVLRYDHVEASEHRASLKPYEYIYETDSSTWNDAKAACESKEAVLAKVGSDAIKTTFKKLISSGGAAWIGATDSVTESEWKWLADDTLIDGSVSYSTWASSQPDNWKNNGNKNWIDGEDCATFKKDGTLNDAHCTQNRFGYICQKYMLVFTDVNQLYFSNDKKSWNDAKVDCRTDGSYLARIDLSGWTSLFSDKFTTQNEWRWIGASGPGGRSGWKWSNGSLVNSPINWRSGEPNGGRSQKCAAIDFEGNWLDHSCPARIKYICQKRLPSTVSHGGHVFKFHRTTKVSWDAAKTACARSGSRLAEIYDTATNDVIRSNILNPGQMFYSGGSLNGGTVTWDSGAPGNLFAWAAGEPNNNGPSKIALSTRGWVDVDQTPTLPFICETASMTAISSRQAKLTVGVDSEREVTCSADGIPAASVSWRFSSAKVRSMAEGSRVYQTETPGKSVLHVEGAKLTDEGTYTCVAQQRLRTFRKILRKKFKLAVPSVPEAAIVEAMNCSTEVEVKWKANARALNINHRITVTNAQDEAEIYSFLKVQTSNRTFRFTARKWGMYIMTVTPCPNDACKEEYSRTNHTSRLTVGRPGLATHLQVTSLNNYSCSFSWGKPNDVPDEYITKYKVIVTARLHKRPNVSTFNQIRNEITMDRGVTKYSTQEKPNFLYKFAIQVQTCAGNGNITPFKRCVTDAEAPENVEKPIVPMYVNSNGTMIITVNIPSHKNGPMSCLFVIVKELLPGSNTIDSQTEREGLIRENMTNGEQIAFVLNLTSGLEGQKNVVLGDGGGSTCQLSAGEADNNVFVGQNLRLDPYKNYSVFVVTSTPTTKNGILFKSSRSARVMAIPEPVDEYDVYLKPHEYIFVSEAKIWNDAKRFCKSRKATLAEIGSEAITQLIKKNFPTGHSEMWIVNRLADDAGARGKNIAYEDRVSGDQRNSMLTSGPAVDGCFVITREGELKSLPCSKYRRGFVCQKNVVIVDHHLLLLSYERQTWAKAKAKCEHEGMHLVKIDSALLNSNLSESFVGARWIGASDEKSEGDWRWLDGTTANQNAKKSGGDEEGENGNCAVILDQGKLKNLSCSLEKKYICYKSLVVFTDQYKLFFSYDKKNRTQAQAECSKDGSHLINVDSETLKNVIAKNSNELRWSGAFFNATEVEWKRVDGQNNEGNCTVVTANATLSNVSCSRLKKFICQKSLPLTVTHNSHLFTFHRVKKLNWYKARDACRRNGAILAEIYNHATDAAVRDHIINVDAMFFSGGHVDGTSVTWDSGRNVTYSSGWAIEEPNHKNHNKIALTTIGWKDVSSTQNLPYICEMANLTDVKLSHAKLTLGVDDNKMVTCMADGVPFSEVLWKFLQTNVTFNVSGPVYQEKGDGRSVLHVGSATLLDEGMYTCVAENQAGHFKKSMVKNFTLKASGSRLIGPNSTHDKITAASEAVQCNVPSAPDWVVVEAGKCSSTIHIKYNPNSKAHNVKHRVTVTDAENRSYAYNLDNHLKKNSGEILDLHVPKWMLYNVTVTPCPKNTCKDKHSITNRTSRRTAGLPAKAENLRVELSNKYSCKVGWEKPTEDPKEFITNYKVIVTEKLSYSGSTATESVNEILVRRDITIHSVVGKPNTQYNFGVQAETCAGLGNITWSNGSCITDTKEPEFVPKPETIRKTISGGKMEITITIPSQANGQISCIFVIVEIHGPESQLRKSKSPRSYTRKDLVQANATNETTHLALALPLKSVPGNMLNEILGDERTTTCELSSMARRSKRATKDNVFIGQNSKLDQYKSTTVFIVTGTPTADGFLLKASKDIRIKAIPKESGTTTATTAASVVGAIFILIVIVAIVLWVKRRRRKAENRTVSPVESAYAEVGDGAIEMTEVTTRPKTVRATRTKKQNETDIPMNDFEAIYNSLHHDRGAAFTEQFEKLVEKAKSLPLSVQFASKHELKSKNRYKNILPFDNTRVPILHSDDGYINACFIDGFEQKKKFIATQGPLVKTVSDFWLMIVEQKVTSIVMLAKCLEAGKKKCEKYWPDIGQTSNYGPVTVSNINETRSCGYVCRSLRVKAKLESKHEMTVTQYHFLTWPDHGFPLTTSHILRLHKKLIDDRKNTGSTSPIVVHCSAGAGRTGTLIGYDYLLNESRLTGKADVFECVVKMRSQRVQMVQNCDQFILIHKLLLETHILHDTDISRQEVLMKFSDPRYKKKAAEEEFTNLSRVKPLDISERGTGEKISAYERMRVKMFEDGSEIARELYASFVEAYDDDLKIIAARQPATMQIELLWKLSFDLNINTIVMISENEDNPPEYWSFCPQGGKFTVHVHSEDAFRKFTIRKLQIQGPETKFITHLHLQLNSSNATRRTVSTINDCVNRLQKELRESHGAVLIHCKSGTGMSGVFCAMMNILERLAVEDRVDVFRAVKDLRDCKEGMVETQEQYELCYDGVLEYLRNFDTYSNFM